MSLAASAATATPLIFVQAGKSTDTRIAGYVKDETDKEPIQNVTLSVKGTNIGTVSDKTGHYSINGLPEGGITIEARCIGYLTVQKCVNILPNTTLELNFELKRDEIALDEVVVTANRSQTARSKAPNIVNVLGSALLESTHAVCLMQGLDFQPGVRTETDCQNCGFTQVRINGLDGHYSQILLDSRPVFSALTGVYGLEQIPAAMIDRVEVVRGGGSALFGASAIGGTINVITKEPTQNSAELSHSLMSIGGSGSLDCNTSLNASIVTDDNRAGICVFGQKRNRDGYDADGDGYTEITKLRSQSIGLQSFIKIGSQSKLTLQYHGISDFRRGGNELDLPPFEANIAEQTEHDINGGGVNYNFSSPDDKNRADAYFSFQNTSRQSYYGGIGEGTEDDMGTARKAYGKTHDLTLVAGTQYIHSFDNVLFMPSDLTLGTEYSYDGTEDKTIGYNWELNQKIHITSAFIQNEWKNDHWTILIGERVDKHNLIDHAIFSPRINLRYSPARNISFRAGYSEGFRAPQAYDEDMHVAMVGGERQVVRLADSLKEERSHSLTLSADFSLNFKTVSTDFLIEGFYTDLDNVFAERVLSEPDSEGNEVLERYNAYGAKVYGIDFEGKIVFTPQYRLEAGLTLQKSLYDEAVEWDEDAPAQRRMMRTPDVYGYFTSTANPIKRLELSLSATYTGTMLIGHAAGSGVDKPVAVETPGFFMLDIKTSYDLQLGKEVALQINAGIQNITDAFQKDFDKGWNRDSGYIYGPSLPRSFFAGVKISY